MVQIFTASSILLEAPLTNTTEVLLNSPEFMERAVPNLMQMNLLVHEKPCLCSEKHFIKACPFIKKAKQANLYISLKSTDWALS